MEGNEDKCPTCHEEIEVGQYFTCDSCLIKIHKNCINLSGSEMKCMPLQKRMLLFVCVDCKKLIARLPYMIKVLEEMKQDIKEIKRKTSTQDMINSPDSYAQVLNKNLTNGNKTQNTPTLIIKPKNMQDSKTTQNDIRQNINPTELKVGIKNMRNTKQGTVIVKCTTKQELDVIKNAAENSLKDNYKVETPKMRLPRIKIIGYTGKSTTKQIEDSIKKQNSWITQEDTFKVTYIKIMKEKNKTTIFAECSPTLFQKIMQYKKVFIDWERCVVYEDLVLTRCFNCQGFYHKNNVCNKKKACSNCAQEHDNAECPHQFKKCQNCLTANSTYKTKHDVNHTANDPSCPSYNYHIEVLRARINYGT